MDHPEEFYDYLRNNLYYPKAKPNNVQKALAELEKMGKLKAIITQNIEFHGSITRKSLQKLYMLPKEFPNVINVVVQ